MFLFIDTAVMGCNVAVASDTEILAIAQEPIERGHAEALIPLYEHVMQQANVKPEALTAIYTAAGPGSFTGLRVGLTVARMIGYTLSIPVHGITTFQGFSAGVEGQATRFIVIETKRSDYYVQLADYGHNPIGEAQSIDAAAVAEILIQYPDCIITGDAVERLSQEIKLPCDKVFPQTMLNVQNIIKTIQVGGFETREAEAFYIRDAHVSQPKIKSL